MTTTTNHHTNPAGVPPAPPEAHQRAEGDTTSEHKEVCMFDMTATYSPEDNKLRLYSVHRLDRETYGRVREAGFRWAAKQQLFVAPAWTPAREDLLVELCGEIGDEDTSLVDRAEQRAERFEGYEDRRTADAEAAHQAVKSIADPIPLGQPILVGHHSERRARKDAERIENGMRKAVRMWDTAQYWQRRAAGAIRHAKYKERPDVRARRIKGLEADARKWQRTRDEADALLALWRSFDPITLEDAVNTTNYLDHTSQEFPLSEYPRPATASQYEGSRSLWSALTESIITPERARAIAVPVHERTITRCDRWLAHLANRLTYERAMLEDQGGADLLKPKPRPKQLPLCNYRAPEGIDVQNPYDADKVIHHPQVEMTKAEWAAIHADYKGTRVVDHSHRVRTAMQRHTLVCVFLTDSKTHPRPAAAQPPSAPEPHRDPRPVYTPAAPTQFDTLRQQLREGVQVVAAPQLFPTPPELAARMVDLAGIEPGHRVLDPSAGTGHILRAVRTAAHLQGIGKSAVRTAVEIDARLCDRLRTNEAGAHVVCGDFLQCSGELGTFDRILMNPPFERAVDIQHIRHALGMLKDGGRLVAICANGPRQRATLIPLVEACGGEWMDLAPDTFKESGTGVNTALVILYRELSDRDPVVSE